MIIYYTLHSTLQLSVTNLLRLCDTSIFVIQVMYIYLGTNKGNKINNYYFQNNNYENYKLIV